MWSFIKFGIWKLFDKMLFCCYWAVKEYFKPHTITPEKMPKNFRTTPKHRQNMWLLFFIQGGERMCIVLYWECVLYRNNELYRCSGLLHIVLPNFKPTLKNSSLATSTALQLSVRVEWHSLISFCCFVKFISNVLFCKVHIIFEAEPAAH